MCQINALSINFWFHQPQTNTLIRKRYCVNGDFNSWRYRPYYSSLQWQQMDSLYNHNTLYIRVLHIPCQNLISWLSKKKPTVSTKFLRGRVYAIVWNNIRIGLDKFASQEISESLFMLHPSSFETISLLYTWRQTMHSIKESNTLKWIITMSVKEWP